MKKAQYIGYTDASFTKRSDHPAERGLLGPLIAAEVQPPPLSHDSSVMPPALRDIHDFLQNEAILYEGHRVE